MTAAELIDRLSAIDPDSTVYSPTGAVIAIEPRELVTLDDGTLVAPWLLLTDDGAPLPEQPVDPGEPGGEQPSAP